MTSPIGLCRHSTAREINKLRINPTPCLKSGISSIGCHIDPALMAFVVWGGVKEVRNGCKVISVRQRFNIIKLK